MLEGAKGGLLVLYSCATSLLTFNVFLNIPLSTFLSLLRLIISQLTRSCTQTTDIEQVTDGDLRSDVRNRHIVARRGRTESGSWNLNLRRVLNRLVGQKLLKELSCLPILLIDTPIGLLLLFTSLSKLPLDILEMPCIYPHPFFHVNLHVVHIILTCEVL